MTQRRGRLTEERWQELTNWPLVIASLAFIVAYSWQVIAELHGLAFTVARTVMFVTWIVFVVDYVVRLAVTQRRGRWFVRHLFDLVVVLIPALRPLRLLKAVTVIHTLQRTAGSALRNSIVIYGVAAVLTLIWVASLAVLEAERSAEGATITSFGDAVWWAFVTVTTVGYGDYTPVTAAGRVIAVLLMAGGVGVVGVVTATFSSWVLETAAGPPDPERAGASRADVQAVARQINDLAAQLGRPVNPAAGDGGIAADERAD